MDILTDKKIGITLLTVGEYPSLDGLHASQVLPFGEYLVKKRSKMQLDCFLSNARMDEREIIEKI